MDNLLNLTPSQRLVSRLIYRDYLRKRRGNLSRFGCSSEDLVSQIDTWVYLNIKEEGDKYNDIFFYNFCFWFAKGYIGDPKRKENSVLYETDISGEGDGDNKQIEWLSLEPEKEQDKRLDLEEILLSLSDNDIKNIELPNPLKKRGIDWREFFNLFKEQSITAENIRKELDLTKWEYTQIVESINKDLAPALRRLLPDYVEGDQQAVSFRGENRIEGGEEKLLKRILSSLEKFKSDTMSGSLLFQWLLGGSNYKKASVEKHDLFDRAIKLGLDRGVIVESKTKKGLDGFSLKK